jgi:sorbitol-6-phosphate 2-dehydrogenase
MKTLSERYALVTGGAQGLGEALSLRLAREGCCGVAIADINLPAAANVARKIEKDHGVKSRAIEMDITDETSVEEGFRVLLDEFERLDILVSNAGIVISGAIENLSAEHWRKVIDVNLNGYFLVAKHASRIMIERKSGVIIQINSKSGKSGSYRNSAYAASKFGGIGLTQSLALELAEHGIRVNCICPGNLLDSPLWVNTLYEQYGKNLGITEEALRQRNIDLVPMKRGCTYDDVANVVVFVASDAASYMTGQAVNVTGGQEMR